MLCCGRICPDQASAERIRILLNLDLDWAYLTGLATRLKTKPLLFWNLQACGSEFVPPTVLNQLKNSFQNNAWFNHFLSQKVADLVEMFQQNGISVIPFKGVSLAASLYGDLTLRQTGDLDMLVSPKNFQQARELLIGQDFKPRVAADNESVSDQLAYHDETFTKTDKGRFIWLDLHRQLMPPYYPFSPTFEALWSRCRPMSLAGRSVPDLSVEDLLHYLCVHGGRHTWSELRWLTDVAELVDLHQETLDWTGIMNQAEVYGIRRMLMLGLFLAHNLLNAAVPAPVLTEANSDSAVRSLAGNVTSNLFQKEKATKNDPVRRFLFRLRALDSHGDKLRYLGFFVRIKSSGFLFD